MVGTLTKDSNSQVPIGLCLSELTSQWLLHLLGMLEFRLEYIFLKSGQYPTTWGALVGDSVQFLSG
jgi:hypothetical protein